MRCKHQVQYLALFRGVMPMGPNRIPEMSDLVQLLETSGLDNVSSYIQSGNVICETSISAKELARHIHQLILEKIGANLAIIVKEKSDLEKLSYKILSLRNWIHHGFIWFLQTVIFRQSD